MATGGNEALFDNGKKSMFLFLCQWLSFFCSICIIFIYTPLHSYFLKEIILDFISPAHSANLIRCLSLWMGGSLLWRISLTFILFRLCYAFTLTKETCFSPFLSPHISYVAMLLQFSKAVASLLTPLKKDRFLRLSCSDVGLIVYLDPCVSNFKW